MTQPWVIRRMTLPDLPEILALQASCYPPSLREGPAAFRSRLTSHPATHLIAETAAGVSGYLVSHPWHRGSPPPFDGVLPPHHGSGECWFVHDLAVSPRAHGSGLGRALYAAGRTAAASLGLSYSELIAVQGAAGFWRDLGYAEAEVSPAVAATLERYGTHAIYMARQL